MEATSTTSTEGGASSAVASDGDGAGDSARGGATVIRITPATPKDTAGGPTPGTGTAGAACAVPRRAPDHGDLPGIPGGDAAGGRDRNAGGESSDRAQAIA